MNIFEMAQIPLNKAIETMELDAGAAAIIAVPERTLEVSIPVKMDLPAIAASTAQSLAQQKAVYAIIRM